MIVGFPPDNLLPLLHQVFQKLHSALKGAVGQGLRAGLQIVQQFLLYGLCDLHFYIIIG